jgi:hypothetical protein
MDYGFVAYITVLIVPRILILRQLLPRGLTTYRHETLNMLLRSLQ